MTKNILLGVVIAIASVTPRQYAGPQCLGPFCLNVQVSDRSIFERVNGTGKTSGPNPHCYEDESGGFLYFETIDTEPHTVGDVFLSAFPNCLHMYVNKTSKGLREWKTAEGIGLGSTEEDLLKVYGDPTFQIPINESSSGAQGPKADTAESIARLRIRGFRKGDRSPTVADRRLFYGPDANSNDLRAAEFGICGGKVSWIFLSRNE